MAGRVCVLFVRAFRGDNSEFTHGNFRSIRSSVKASGKVGRAADAQAAFVDGTHVVFVNVIGVDFDVFQARKVCRKQASDRATADNADLHAHAVLRASAPE